MTGARLRSITRRLARGGPGEALELVWRRTGGRLWDRFAAPLVASASAARALRRLTAEFAARPVSVRERLAWTFPDGGWEPWGGGAALAAAASAASRGHVRVLGVDCDLTATACWHRDPSAGVIWPMAWGPAIGRAPVRPAADVKVPWDLSRGSFLVTLGAAGAYADAPAFVSAAERWWVSWLDANPTGVGVNWALAMEAALRASHWVLALAWLEDRIAPALRARVLASLVLHGRFVRRQLEWVSPVLGNHFFSNLAGLAVLGAVFRDRREGRRWLAFAHDQLEREVPHQFLPDGANFEASLPYHRFVLEMALTASLAFRGAGRAWSPAARTRLRAAAMFLRDTQRGDGTVPRVGDDDDGRALVAWGAARDAVGPTLAAASLIDGASDGADALLGIARRGGDRSALATPAARCIAPHGGIAVLRGEPLSVLFIATANGQDGNGGHAHNDKLGIELWHGAEVVVADPGMATYTRAPAVRDGFRATMSHATVAVDGLEQNPMPALFRLPDLSRARFVAADVAGAAPWVEGEHEGYRRLPDPVRHRRRVTLVDGGRAVVLEDALEARDAHEYIWTFPTAGVRPLLEDVDAARLAAGVVVLRMTGLAGAKWSVDPLPWAPHYGHRRDGWALRCRWRGAAARVTWTFSSVG